MKCHPDHREMLIAQSARELFLCIGFPDSHDDVVLTAKTYVRPSLAFVCYSSGQLSKQLFYIDHNNIHDFCILICKIHEGFQRP